MTEQIEKAAAFVRRKLAESHLAAEFAAGTATALWRERVGSYLDFYRRLKKQLEASVRGAAAPAFGGTGNIQAGTFLELAGRM